MIGYDMLLYAMISYDMLFDICFSPVQVRWKQEKSRPSYSLRQHFISEKNKQSIIGDRFEHRKYLNNHSKLSELLPYVAVAMFPCGETAYSNAGDGQERDEVASEEHGPGSPRVVRQQDQYTGHQVEVSN